MFIFLAVKLTTSSRWKIGKFSITQLTFWTSNSRKWRSSTTENKNFFFLLHCNGHHLMHLHCCNSPSNMSPNWDERESHDKTLAVVHWQSSFWKISVVQPDARSNSIRINNVQFVRNHWMIDCHNSNKNTYSRRSLKVPLEPCRNSSLNVWLPGLKKKTQIQIKFTNEMKFFFSILIEWNSFSDFFSSFFQMYCQQMVKWSTHHIHLENATCHMQNDAQQLSEQNQTVDVGCFPEETEMNIYEKIEKYCKCWMKFNQILWNNRLKMWLFPVFFYQFTKNVRGIHWFLPFDWNMISNYKAQKWFHHSISIVALY